MGNNQGWGTVSAEAAYRRAGGRRGYNRARQGRADARRRVVAGLLRNGLSGAEIARRLGVHRCTISRDAAMILVRRCYWAGAPRTRREAAPALAAIRAYLEAGGDPARLPEFSTVRGLWRAFGR